MTAAIRDSLAQVQELKPCPFCGGQPRIDEGMRGYPCILCGTCGASSDYASTDDVSEAITAWNNRHGAGDAEDAARYRWLRAAHGSNDFGFWHVCDFAGCIIGQQPEELDAAIDAARAGERG